MLSENLDWVEAFQSMEVGVYVYKGIHLPMVYVYKGIHLLDVGIQTHTPTYCVGVQRHTPNVWCVCTNAYTIHSPYIKTLKKEEVLG